MNSPAETFRSAMALHRAGRTAEAESIYREVLKGEPEHFGALQHLGIICADRGANEEAASLYSRAARIQPGDTVLQFQLAGVLAELGRLEEALACYDGALAQRPDLAPLHSGRGSVLHAMERYQEALESYDRALALHSKDPLTKANRAGALQLLGRSEEALTAYQEALALNPNDASARVARALILLQRNQPEKACADFERAARLDPTNTDALFHFGTALNRCASHAQAAGAFSAVLSQDPGNAEAYAYRGGARSSLRLLDEALADCDRAIALKPELAEAYYIRANILNEMGRGDESLADCAKALALAPGLTIAACSQFMLAAKNCDWKGRAEATRDLVQRCREGQDVQPFILLFAIDDPELHLKAARQAAGEEKSAPRAAVPRKRLRVAYLSPDFRDHAVAHQAVELFERHDKSRFETFGLCLSRGDEEPIRQRLRKSFDRFLDVGTKSDPELAGIIAELGIDIAVDLAGFTNKGRMKALAHRPAPVAVNYLGYPGTSGAPYIDYIIADDVVIPPGAEGYYSEKIVRLPRCFMPRDTQSAGAAATPSRTAAGLPENAFVFCGFNSSHKIDPPIFDVWMRLLGAVDASVLWMNAANDKAQHNLRREAEARNIAPQRLIFADRVKDRAQYLARLPLADLFLDTFGYGAHATASDMLWAGVPVLTCTGRSFATRVAASMLTVSGLAELIATDLDDYEKRALDLAQTPAQLSALRGRLAKDRETNPLFDIAGYCRHLERAYETMWECCLDGRKPESFSISDGVS